MKHPVFISLAVLSLSLSACSPEGKQAADANLKAAENTAGAVAANNLHTANKYATLAKDNLYKTSYQIQKWVATPPEAPKPPRAIEQTYCYKSFHDILCYRAPLPGAEHRLIAYQGTGAEPPPQAVTELLPTQTMDANQLPQNRVANARPVFIGLPPPIKDDKTPVALGEIPPEAIPVQQPNPALVPQL